MIRLQLRQQLLVASPTRAVCVLGLPFTNFAAMCCFSSTSTRTSVSQIRRLNVAWRAADCSFERFRSCPLLTSSFVPCPMLHASCFNQFRRAASSSTTAANDDDDDKNQHSSTDATTTPTISTTASTTGVAVIPARDFNVAGNDKVCLENVRRVLEDGAFLAKFATLQQIPEPQLRESFKQFVSEFGKALLDTHHTWAQNDRLHDATLNQYLSRLKSSTSPTSSSSSPSTGTCSSSDQLHFFAAVAIFIIHYLDLKLDPTVTSLFQRVFTYAGTNPLEQQFGVGNDNLWNTHLAGAVRAANCYIGQGSSERSLREVVADLGKTDSHVWDETFRQSGILLSMSPDVASVFKSRWLSARNTQMCLGLLEARKVPGVLLDKEKAIEMPTKPDARVFNVVAGPSGSGKTVNSIMIGAAVDQTAPNVVLLATGEQVTSGLIAANEEHKLVSDAPLRQAVACVGVLRAVCRVLRIEGDAGVKSAFDSITLADHATDTSLRQRFVSDTLAPAVQKALGIRSCFDRNLVIVVDEVGAAPWLIRGLCNQRAAIAGLVAQMLMLSPTSQVTLVAAGTGAENFQVQQLGTFPNEYVVFVVNSSPLFAWNLAKLIDEFTAKGPPNPRPYESELQFLTGLRELLFDKESGYVRRSSVDITCHRFLQLVSDNSRCAGIALDLVRKLVIPDPPSSAFGLPAWPEDAVRSLLPAWSLNIVTRFARMNGLGALQPSEKKKVLHECIRVVMNRVDWLRPEQWDRLAVRTGLLVDTAMWIPKSECDGNVHLQVLNRGDNHNTPIEKHESNVHLFYVYEKDKPRFRLSEAFVAMYLLQLGGCLAGSGSLVAASAWQILEIAVADYNLFRLLIPGEKQQQQQPQQQAAANTRASPTAASPSGVAPHKKPLLASPRRIFTLASNTLPLNEVHSGTLPHRLSGDAFAGEGRKFFVNSLKAAAASSSSTPPAAIRSNSKTTASASSIASATAATTGIKRSLLLDADGKTIASERELWSSRINKNEGLVLVNAPSSSFADIIALAPNKIFLTQCKSRSSSANINSLDVQAEFAKMSLAFCQLKLEAVKSQELPNAKTDAAATSAALAQLTKERSTKQKAKDSTKAIDKKIDVSNKVVSAAQKRVDKLENDVRLLEERLRCLHGVFGFLVECCTVRSSSPPEIEVVHTLVVSDASCLRGEGDWNADLFQLLNQRKRTTPTLPTPEDGDDAASSTIHCALTESFHIVAAQGSSVDFDREADCDGVPFYPVLQAALPQDPSVQAEKNARTKLTSYSAHHADSTS